MSEMVGKIFGYVFGYILVLIAFALIKFVEIGFIIYTITVIIIFIIKFPLYIRELYKENKEKSEV